MAKNEDLDFPVLVCIATAPAGRHGYAVYRTLEDRLHVGATFQSVYRVIRRLVLRGLVVERHAPPQESRAGPARKICSLSPAGRAEVRQLEGEQERRAERTAAILRYLREHWHDGDDGQAAA